MMAYISLNIEYSNTISMEVVLTSMEEVKVATSMEAVHTFVK